MNSKIMKNIIKNLFSEKTALYAGNLTYLIMLSIAPTLIITMSIFNIITQYFPLLEHPYLSTINSLLSTLNLNLTSNIIINLICINLLSNGFFSLLSTLEKTYKFSFKNYWNKKLYSVAISIILILIVVTGLSLSFTLANYNLLNDISFLTDFIIIFISLLIFYKLASFQKFKNIYLGSAISSLLLTIFIKFFYLTITNFSDLSSYYGLLTPIIITILLIYYSCYIIYLGIIINYETSKFSRIKILNG